MIERLRVRIPAGAAGEISSPELTLCADSYSVSARKRSWSFCQKCRWQVTPKHADTLDPTKSEWADYAAVQVLCGNLSGNELTHNLSRNIRLQSSQLAKPLWTDPGVKSGISVHVLISTNTHTHTHTRAHTIHAHTHTHTHTYTQAQARKEWSSIPPKSSPARK